VTAPSGRGPRGADMYYNHTNINFARKLRKEMTPWERKLWYCFLNKYEIRFSRQKLIDQYIVDFYCSKASLVVELDGGEHYNPESEESDRKRTQKLESLGLKVIRFCNMDIDKNFDYIIKLPKTNKYLSPILSVIPLQLLSYYVAKERKLDVDKPRNLAKSVTVE
jgi:very-short-patch-repair endonuclease